MDALDVLCQVAEVRRVVDLVLEQDAGHAVADEVGRLHDVARRVQEVGLEAARRHRQLQVAARLHVGIADGAPPHLQRVGAHGVLGRRFLVLAVERLIQAVRPRVAVVPVEHAADGEVGVVRGRVGDVADKGVDEVFVLREPGGVEIADDGGGVDEIAVVEVVIVVVGVSEVSVWVAGDVGRGRYDSAPGCFMDEGVDLCVGCEDCKGGFEVGEACLG